MKFLILGPVESARGDRRLSAGAPQQVALLTFLLLHRNHIVATDQVHDALWPARDQAGAAKRVQMAVARLRGNLAALEREAGCEPAVRTTARGYLLSATPGDLDADAFEAGLAAGRALLADGDPGTAAGVLREALALWRGPALAEAAFEDFAQPEIRRLEDLRLEALDARVEADLALGRHHAVIGELQARLAEHPARERVCEQLMLALYRSGRQSEALDAYRQLAAHVSRELGLAPGPALRTLQDAVIDHAPSLGPPGAAPGATPPPPSGGPAVAAPFPLPSAIAPARAERGPFVGRASAMAQLAGAYRRAASGERRVVVLSGEPGIGKTRLATQFALDAHGDGAIVLAGRCDEELLLPQQPFVEALRHYVRHCPASLLRGRAQLIWGELRRLVPELAERVPELAQPISGDPDGARHRLFEAVAAMICDAAREQPVVLVLDDLHWADDATLLLLKYVARYPREARLMIVGTYRDTDVDDAHPLAGALAELRRERRLDHVALDRLDEQAVYELVGRLTGDDASADVRRMVYEETRGLAFFVVEISRHIGDTARDELKTPRGLPLPDGIASLVRRRIARLGPGTERVLDAAAVLGSSFELEVLGRVCDLDEYALVDALEPAVHARLVDEPQGSSGRHAFSHSLIRDVLYDAQGRVRRARLHRRAAAALEAVHAGGELPFAELAHHLEAAASAEDLQRALGFASRAAEQALAMLAYEQAAGHLRRALTLLDRCEGPEPQRCDLTIALGEAQRASGDPAHRDTLLDGARIAAALGDAGRLARAALANHRGFNSSSLGVDRERVAALETALELIGDEEGATRARVLAQLAAELVSDADWQRRAGLADEALEIARAVGDEATLARVLTQHCIAQWRPSTLASRIAHIGEALVLAESTGERAVAGYAANFGAYKALESGDVARADALLAKLRSHADELHEPVLEWFDAIARATRCTIVGTPQEAERLAFVASEIGQRSGQPDTGVWFLGHLYVARLLGGTLDAADPYLPGIFEAVGSAPPAGPEYEPGRSVPLLVSAAVSAILCEIGRVEDARAHFELVRAALADPPNDYTRLSLLSSASIACAHLADAGTAARLHALLEPFADQFANTGASWMGAIVHHLALLEGVMERFDEADERFASADRAYARLAAVGWRTRCRLDWASLLLRRGRDGDAERAGALAGTALSMAERLDLGAVAARAQRLRTATRSSGSRYPLERGAAVERP